MEACSPPSLQQHPQSSYSFQDIELDSWPWGRTVTSGNWFNACPFNLSFGTKAMFSFYRAPWLKMLLFIISFFYLFYLYLFNIRSCIFLRAELYFIPSKLCKRYFQIAQVLALWFWRIQIYSYSK